MNNCPNPLKNRNCLKAFVLGCDPTGFDSERKCKEFEYVFDIGGDRRYFAGVLENLNLLNLTLDDIYVQNLITDYQDEETTKNDHWGEIAIQYITERKEEFDNTDPNKLVPIFLTSEHLYKVLLHPNQKRHTASELYSNNDLIPIKPEDNRLGRPLIPLYRHYSYRLEKQTDYLAFLKSIFQL